MQRNTLPEKFLSYLLERFSYLEANLEEDQDRETFLRSKKKTLALFELWYEVLFEGFDSTSPDDFLHIGVTNDSRIVVQYRYTSIGGDQISLSFSIT